MLRLDKYLADMGTGTRSQVKQMIGKGRVSVNGTKILRLCVCNRGSAGKNGSGSNYRKKQEGFISCGKTGQRYGGTSSYH